METTNFSQTRLLYNPQLQSAEMTEKLFVVRQKQFAFLLDSILKEKENSIAQHHLIIGQRGMGKTTILKRMEVELHKEQYRERFIPLLYREEQYNVKDLAEFWLNTLDALADSLQTEKCPAEKLEDIDKTIRELSRKAPEAVSKEAYEFLMDTCRELHRRPVLLIDNIDIVFSGLDSGGANKQEQWALRKLLSENGAPIIIGGGVTTTDDVAKYEMPFYDFFKIQYLRKLDYNEFVELLTNLATVTNSDTPVFTAIQQNASRQKALLELTGGSPRVTVILFDQISKGFSSNINDDLNILADAITPLYKAKFEELPPQQRVIIDAVALNWDAISLRKLAIATRMKNNQLSPQLKRLVDTGWLETTSAYEDKGNAYFISERFFNIYYLIRNSSRRHKDKIYCLSKFLECFYGEDDLKRISETLLDQDICNPEQMRLHLAMSMIKTLKPNKRKRLQEKIAEAFRNNEELRKEFDYQPEESALLEKGRELIFKNWWDTKNWEDVIKYFDKAIKLYPDNSDFWREKGGCLYFSARYEEAIDCFDKAIKLNPKGSYSWNSKGDAFIELKKYDEAVKAYEQSLSCDFPDLFAMFSLIFLYRDKLDEMEKAMELFNSIDKQEVEQDKYFLCQYYLNKVAFELYNQNKGLAKENLLQTFDILDKEDRLAAVANEHWWIKFGSTVVKLGYGSWLLDILEEKGYDIVLSPYYTAIRALEIETQDSKAGKKNAELYLNNRAIEIGNPARAIIEKIRRYMD